MQKIVLYSLILAVYLLMSGCAGPMLHGIGVYEGSYEPGIRHSFGNHPDGHIDVKIDTETPVILVLTSYEPVIWNVVSENEIQIYEIILSGYHPSKVSGVSSKTKVTRKPFGYSYKEDSESSKFAVKVFEYTGIPEFESFQGSYKGELFLIQ